MAGCLDFCDDVASCELCCTGALVELIHGVEDVLRLTGIRLSLRAG
jgi:hypothetical protein